WISGRGCSRPLENGFPRPRGLRTSEEKNMAAERGSAFLLKIGDGAAPPAYATVAGLKTTQLSINGDAVAITNKGSGGWRELLSGAGVRSVSVAASGIFTGGGAAAKEQALALSGARED